MPKVKIPRKNISLDMTAMCDMAFLLLTFFILTSNFKPQEPVAVDIPSSADTLQLPKDSMMVISLDKDGNIFFGLGNQNERQDLIRLVNEQLKLDLDDKEMKKFSNLETFGIPFSQMKTYLNKEGSLAEGQPGIPADSTNNELKKWIFYAKQVRDGMRISIRGDMKSSFKDTQKIIHTLQDLRLSKISFVTNLEGTPDIKL